MKLCPSCKKDQYQRICDFCLFYIGRRNKHGEKKCKITKKVKNPIDSCKKFHCFMV